MLALNTAIADRKPALHRFNLAARHIAARNRFNGSPRFRCGFFLDGGAIARATDASGGRLGANALRAGPRTFIWMAALIMSWPPAKRRHFEWKLEGDSRAARPNAA